LAPKLSPCRCSCLSAELRQQIKGALQRVSALLTIQGSLAEGGVWEIAPGKSANRRCGTHTLSPWRFRLDHGALGRNLAISEQRGATAPDIAPPRRLAAIQSSVAPSFGKADIMTSQAALFVNPCPTSKERLAESHGRLQPADFRNSAMDVRDEPREVAMCSLTTGG